jgi:hypothetical protein
VTDWDAHRWYFDEDSTLCAAIPHAILNLTVVWCAHQMRYTLHATHTDDSGAQLASYQHPFGPFDGTEEVVASAAHEVLRWLGVDHDRRHQHRE